MTKFLMMAMSLRKDSINKKLINSAHQLLTSAGGPQQFEKLLFNEFLIPVYDGDEEAQSGVPESVKKLGQKITEADALIFSTPEYNGGIPGPFKNAIDWVSRITPMPWPGKHLLLLGTSPGGLGAVRGLWHSRVPLEAVGVFVYPEMFGLPQGNQAFDDAGKLKDSQTEQRLQKLLLKFRDHVRPSV